MAGLQKNIASQKWLAFAFDRTDNTPKTGDAGNITAKIRKDYGAASATNDVNPTEIEDGYYEFDLTQAESNANICDLLPESATSDIQVIGVPGRVFTVPPGFADLGTRGTVVITVAPTTSMFECDDITEPTTDHFKGRIWTWTSGDLAGQQTGIVAYSLQSGRGRFTVNTMTEAPGDNDEGTIT